MNCLIYTGNSIVSKAALQLYKVTFDRVILQRGSADVISSFFLFIIAHGIKTSPTRIKDKKLNEISATIDYQQVTSNYNYYYSLQSKRGAPIIITDTAVK